MIYLQYCNEQNDGMTDTAVEKKDDEVNHIETQELGWSKRKRIPRRLANALNGCLCGLVLNGSSSGALKCKQAGCETQWVSNVVLLYWQ
jgi:phosphopantothenoylcysteine synthetase/decarboxylase